MPPVPIILLPIIIVGYAIWNYVLAIYTNIKISVPFTSKDAFLRGCFIGGEIGFIYGLIFSIIYFILSTPNESLFLSIILGLILFIILIIVGGFIGVIVRGLITNKGWGKEKRKKTEEESWTDLFKSGKE